MSKGTPTDPTIKAEILNQIKNEGLSVAEASKQFGIPENTIYPWLRDNGVAGSSRNLILENNRLKKELANAHRVIGAMVAEINRPKG